MLTKRKILGEECGQTLVLGALCMSVLVAFLGLAVDAGLAFCVKRSAQSAADSAAVTAAQELPYGSVAIAAKAEAGLNGYTDGTNGVTVTVNTPPLNGPHKADASYAEVIVSRNIKTIFMGIMKHGTMTVSARAVAATGQLQNCVYALGTTGIDINASNGVTVQLNNCAMFGNSSSANDLSVTGGAHLNAAAFNLVGSYALTNGGVINPSPLTGQRAVADPLAALAPPTWTSSSCVADPVGGRWGTNGKYTIGPSSGGTVCYNGLNISNGVTATLNPGLYIINGALTVGGGSNISGAGVSFYLPVGASTSIANGINFNLAAPTSGAWDGILFYQDRNNSTAESIQGGATSVLKGILYFPKANFTFANGTNTGTYASIICNTLTFAGGATLTNYSQLNTSSPLASGTRIVE